MLCYLFKGELLFLWPIRFNATMPMFSSSRNKKLKLKHSCAWMMSIYRYLYVFHTKLFEDNVFCFKKKMHFKTQLLLVNYDVFGHHIHPCSRRVLGSLILILIPIVAGGG